MDDKIQTNPDDVSIIDDLRAAFGETDDSQTPGDGDTPPANQPDDQDPGTNPDGGNEPATPATEGGEDGGTPAQPGEGDGGEGGDEPATPPATSATEAPEPKLILGKFKSQEDLEKAYVNLEKMHSQKMQKTQEENKFTSPTEFDNAVVGAIERVALRQVEDAVSKIADPEHLKEATAAVAMYRRTGDIQYIDQARGYLDRAADRRLQDDMRNAALEIKQQYGARRDEIMLQPIREGLIELEKEDPEWMKEELHQQVLTAAIKLNNRVNVKSIKEMITQIGEHAVEKYKAAEARKKAIADAKKPNVSVKSATAPTPKTPEKPWDQMSLQEQLQHEFDKKFGEK